MKSWLNALAKTRSALHGVSRFILGGKITDARSIEELESRLIQADVPVRIVSAWIEDIRQAGSAKTPQDRLELLVNEVLPVRKSYSWPTTIPAVILLVGVNGSGKTTTAAKLAYQLKMNGKVPLLAAADTFRAAGTDQLRLWAEKAACDIVAGVQGADAAATAFDAVKAAIARRYDAVLIDTAGRMHTKQHLMTELEKLQRSIGKALPGAPHEVWIVVDATIGNNALNQVRMFNECIGLSGCVITKLDGSSKAGFILGIEKELKVPVRFAGLGESIDDLVPFDPGAFIKALFADD